MARAKWEYKRLTVWGTEGSGQDETVSRYLSTEFGEKGWELISALFQPEGYVYYFKRLKESPSD